jgi:hypothetical protein
MVELVVVGKRLLVPPSFVLLKSQIDFILVGYFAAATHCFDVQTALERPVAEILWLSKV